MCHHSVPSVGFTIGFFNDDVISEIFPADLFILFIWGFAFSTLYRTYHKGVVLWAEETSTYS